MSLEQVETLQTVGGILSRELGGRQLTLTRETIASDVDGWDSLNHIRLIVAVEKHYKIRFTPSELKNFANVGQLCDAIVRKAATKS